MYNAMTEHAKNLREISKLSKSLASVYQAQSNDVINLKFLDSIQDPLIQLVELIGIEKRFFEHKKGGRLSRHEYN